ncbi:MAG: ABC transporter permease [Paracoccaceae bacterium]
MWRDPLSAADPQTRRPAIAPALVPRSRRSFATGRSILALILREMSTRYGRSPGGYLWAVLEPIGAILMLTFGFSLLLRSPSLGNSFILFYATGYLPLSLYMSTSNMVARAIGFSRPLLVYPSVTWADAVLARWILNTLTGLMVTYLLLAGILAVIDTRIALDILPILAALAMAALIGLGVGVMNCVLFGMFPVWTQVWTIVTRPLFLASGIFFIMEDLPPLAQKILWYNPLIHITGLMRTGFYPMYAPDYVSVVFVLSVALVCTALGLVLLRRYHQDILNS